MDIARARSPPASNRRPIGPRNPGRAGTIPVKNIIPLDLTTRLQEDDPIDPHSTSPESVSRPVSPASAPVQLSRSTTRSSEANGHRKSESTSTSTSTPETDEMPRTETGVEGGIVPEEGKETIMTISAPTPDSAHSRKDATCSAPPIELNALPSPDPAEDVPALTESPVQAETPPVISPSPQEDIPADTKASPPWISHPPSPPIPHNNINHTDTARARLTNGTGEVSVHRKSLSQKTQASLPEPSRSSTPVSSTRSSTPALLKMIAKRPLLAAPPPLNFEPEPVQWKAMTLEAAQWTFTSEQLQETVSRAIKQSAAESFIRVLSTETSDVELPKELERLESLRFTTQAQYRFNMHRRGNLLQTLASFSHQPEVSDGEAMYNVMTQVAELTIACDRLMETLLRISDQKAQIQHLQDLHVASALAMALRKLNASYAKRTTELKEVRARNEELRAELEEAWNMAQDMAQEMDDLDNFDLAFSEEEMTPDDDRPCNSALEAEIYGDMDRMSGIASINNAEVIEIIGKAVATKAMLTAAPTVHRASDRTSRVFAAKTRSSRASKASLRIPKTPKTPTSGMGERSDRRSLQSIRSRLSRSRSLRRAESGGETIHVPQVPIIRLPEPNKSKDGSFLELSQTRPVSPTNGRADGPSALPPKEVFIMSPPGQFPPSRSEESPPSDYHPPSTPTFGTIPAIQLPEEQPQEHTQQKNSSWAGRKMFTRRVQSMQPPLSRSAAADAHDADTPQLTRSVSDYKQFDGWPAFFGATKTQRFSVPSLGTRQPLRARKSSDSAPAGSSP